MSIMIPAMSERLTAALRAFYDLFDLRDRSRLLAHFHPDAVLRDHRSMASWGGTRENWGDMVAGWWSIIPDGSVEEIVVLRQGQGSNAHAVTIAGTDSITGGRAEFEYFVVVTVEGGLVRTSDFFDDEASALACWDALPDSDG
jgi:ketosteroid isomerase-like protein